MASTQASAAQGDAVQKKNANSLWSDLKRDYLLYLMVLPVVIWMVLFLYKPMYGLLIAFKQYSIFKGALGSPWVGECLMASDTCETIFAHFVTLFQSDQFVRSIYNTLIISGISLVVGFPMPIILALMCNEIQNHQYRKSIQTILYLPHFISVVIVAGIVVNVLSPSAGLVNNAMALLGLDRIYFLIQPEWFRSIYVGSNIWKEAGFNSIVFLAAIMSINPSLYESAQVDGATRIQMMTKITLPSIIPTIAIMLVIRLGNVLEVGFEYILLLYQPSTYETADVISTYIYRTGVSLGRYDLATAAGVFNAVVALILVLASNKISRKVTRSGVF